MSDVGDGVDGSGTGEGGSEMGGEPQHEPSEHGGPPSETNVQSLEPVRIIHKEQDSITAFCINKVLDLMSDCSYTLVHVLSSYLWTCFGFSIVSHVVSCVSLYKVVCLFDGMALEKVNCPGLTSIIHLIK